MKLIVDISDEMYQTVKNDNWCGNHIIGETIRKGTPLKEWLESFNTDSAPQCFNKIQELKKEVLNDKD